MRRLTIILMLCLTTTVMAQNKCFDHEKYKADLLEYVKNHPDLDKTPFGLHAVTRASEDAPAGVI